MGCLDKQVLNFPKFAANLIRVIFKANVGSTYEKVSVPGDDEKWPPITLRFEIDCVLWRAGKNRHNDVTSLRPADQSRTVKRRSLEHPIHPRSSRIYNDVRTRKVTLPTFINELDS